MGFARQGRARGGGRYAAAALRSLRRPPVKKSKTKKNVKLAALPQAGAAQVAPKQGESAAAPRRTRVGFSRGASHKGLRVVSEAEERSQRSQQLAEQRAAAKLQSAWRTRCELHRGIEELARLNEAQARTRTGTGMPRRRPRASVEGVGRREGKWELRPPQTPGRCVTPSWACWQARVARVFRGRRARHELRYGMRLKALRAAREADSGSKASGDGGAETEKASLLEKLSSSADADNTAGAPAAAAGAEAAAPPPLGRLTRTDSIVLKRQERTDEIKKKSTFMTVRWALGWMLKHEQKATYQCFALILYDALYAAAVPCAAEPARGPTRRCELVGPRHCPVGCAGKRHRRIGAWRQIHPFDRV